MNYSNHSPWIEALEADKIFPKAEGVTTADIGIIGWGIAGIATAYHILSQTDVSVALIEAKKIAHGATGHNAGQVVLYFEKPFQEIVSEYGLECAVQWQKALLDGWDTLQDMIAKLKMEDDFEVCEGYMGVRSIGQLIQHLENKYLRDSWWAQFDGIFIDKNWPLKKRIPEHFLDLCIFVDAKFIWEKLDTNEYFPVMMTSKKACINSALFCQKCLTYLTEHFHERFHVYEDSPVREIRLLPEQKNQIKWENYTLKTTDIILCTNGFENFHIIDLYQMDALSTDHSFHKNISGLIGYMAGFFAPHKKASAISYFPDEEKTDWKSEKYFYITSRSYQNKTEKQSLICTGGPDSLIPHDGHYEATLHDPLESYQEIRGFLKKYRHEEVPEIFPYTWHGLMGYTKTGLRYIGQDTHTPHLWYNLGCNGVWIISSVYGGWKIAKILSGTSFPKSIFDPQ